LHRGYGELPREPRQREVRLCRGPDGPGPPTGPYDPPYNWELCSSIGDLSVIGRSEWSKAKVATGAMWRTARTEVIVVVKNKQEWLESRKKLKKRKKRGAKTPERVTHRPNSVSR
jgi:hypothetical protein